MKVALFTLSFYIAVIAEDSVQQEKGEGASKPNIYHLASSDVGVQLQAGECKESG